MSVYRLANTRDHLWCEGPFATARAAVVAWYALGGRRAGWRIEDETGTRVDEDTLVASEERSTCEREARAYVVSTAGVRIGGVCLVLSASAGVRS